MVDTVSSQCKLCTLLLISLLQVRRTHTWSRPGPYWYDGARWPPPYSFTRTPPGFHGKGVDGEVICQVRLPQEARRQAEPAEVSRCPLVAFSTIPAPEIVHYGRSRDSCIWPLRIEVEVETWMRHNEANCEWLEARRGQLPNIEHKPNNSAGPNVIKEGVVARSASPPRG